MAILQSAECPQMAVSRRSGDEIHPWTPNGDLRPYPDIRHQPPAGVVERLGACPRQAAYLRWSRTGALKPIIDRTFPLDAIADAHRYLESNQQKGKIVVTV